MLDVRYYFLLVGNGMVELTVLDSDLVPIKNMVQANIDVQSKFQLLSDKIPQLLRRCC